VPRFITYGAPSEMNLGTGRRLFQFEIGDWLADLQKVDEERVDVSLNLSDLGLARLYVCC
jgi:hypothetical protein